jgi:tRNA threonylcarbamoyladenosine biosynthesis protein TsaE
VECAGLLARQLKSGDRVLLEGPLGAGKTTFARALLLALGVSQPPEGSPTFAIAHEYAVTGGTGRSSGLRIVHLDLYRLKSEREIDEAGIPDYFWDSGSIVLCEWLSLWQEFEREVRKSGRNWLVKISFPVSGDSTLRDVLINQS